MRLLLVAGMAMGMATLGLAAGNGRASTAKAGRRPVVWYCLRYQAPGENRYAPDGTYRDILQTLGQTFEVKVSAAEPTMESLRGVDVVLLANPNDQAFGTNAPPFHMTAKNIATWKQYIRRGGGLILMGNQDNHNLETIEVNQLLREFGMTFEPNYTDLKRLTIPVGVPALAGLRWAYYSGNQIRLIPDHSAHPRPWVTNDPAQPLLKGQRNAAGILMAGAQLGKGRVIVATDSGWISANALNGVGIGGYYISDHDNPEIIRRMLLWAATQR